MDFTPFVVGDYRCVQRLSVGRSGELFTAIHRPTNAPRVIRRLSPEVMGDRALSEIVLQNLARTRGLNHPNILPIHEIIRRDQAVYVVLEHVHGINLNALLRRVRSTLPLSAAVATFIASQICQALDHAHQVREGNLPTPLVHGALWPPNVLISVKGEIRVSDFGAWVIPTAMHGDAGNVSIRTQFSYRSPEHVNGSTLTSASDLFCVGILLHEMVTGRQLLLGASLMETLELVENATVDHLNDVPPELRSVLARCLEREPMDRYAHPASLISDLSVAVPRSGSREVRKEFTGIIEATARVEGLSSFSLAPQPLAPAVGSSDVDADEGATHRSLSQMSIRDLEPQPVALSPLPGLREDIDEPTGINPTGVTEALVALSKGTTDPGTLEQLFAPQTEDEPTRIDPIIPGITGPAPLPALGNAEDTNRPEGPTDIIPPDPRVLWSSPEEDIPTQMESETVSQRPMEISSFKFVESSTQELTARAASPLAASSSGEFNSEDDPTLQAPQSLIDSVVTSPNKSGIGIGMEEDELTPVTEAQGRRSSIDDDEPTMQAPLVSKPLPGTPKNSTLSWPSLEELEPQPAIRAPFQEEGTPGIESLAQSALPTTGQGLELNLAPDEDGFSVKPASSNALEPQDSMTFDHPSRGEDSYVSRVDSYVSNISSFDAESMFSQSLDRPRTRFTAAHLLLLVAIVVFLIAVGLLVRRLVLQSRRARAPVQQVLDLSVRQHDASGGPRSSSLASDAARPAPADMRVARAAPSDARIHHSGGHLNTLLHLTPGTLRVTTSPVGEVYINGKRLGTSPVNATVRPGDQVRLAVVAPRFAVLRKKLDIPLSKGLVLELTLKEATGYVRGKRRAWMTIHCGRRDLRRILLNDQDTGFSCHGMVSFRLNPGWYKVGFLSVLSDTISVRKVKLRWGRKVHVWAPR